MRGFLLTFPNRHTAITIIVIDDVQAKTRFMPELPEVETVVRSLRQPLIGRRIEAMWYDWEKTIATPDPIQFADRVAGQRVKDVQRRAKYIVVHLDADYLLVHLKMTGRLYVTDVTAQHDADKWVHVRFALDKNRELRFSDARKFGRVYLTDALDEITGALGPEPLADDFTPEVLREQISRRTRIIKPLLLDQSFVAGIGNIYADEALFRAGIHPLRSADSLNDGEIAALHTGIQDALNAGIQNEGASINWYRKPDGTRGSAQDRFLVYGREGLPCLQCGTAITKIRVGQRGTHYCPNCQIKR